MPGNRIWEDADVLDLFAWVDFCLLKDIDFKTTVTQHLNNARKSRSNSCVTLQWPQVKQKLLDKTLDLANHAGLGKKRVGVAHIIEFGTSTIVGFPPGYKEDIERLVSSYKSVSVGGTSEVNHQHSGTSSQLKKPHATLPAPQHQAIYSNTNDAPKEDQRVAPKKVASCDHRFPHSFTDTAVGF